MNFLRNPLKRWNAIEEPRRLPKNEPQEPATLAPKSGTKPQTTVPNHHLRFLRHLEWA
jgi:hypothetical protein